MSKIITRLRFISNLVGRIRKKKSVQCENNGCSSGVNSPVPETCVNDNENKENYDTEDRNDDEDWVMVDAVEDDEGWEMEDPEEEEWVFLDVSDTEEEVAKKEAENAEACHEMEVLDVDTNTFEGSLTLWNTSRFIRCLKNPGHFNFIPVGRFGRGHLPSTCRDKHLVSYLKCLSKFVVRLQIKGTSVARPDDYFCANVRGTDRIRLGTGFAWIPGKVHSKACPLRPCPHNNQHHRVYGPVRILTCKHLVYDQVEAAQLQARFFYDKPDDDRVMELDGWCTLEHSNKNSDTAHVSCYTHSPLLCGILEEHAEALRDSYRAIPSRVFDSCGDIAVVISHPHGMTKTISVGSHHKIQLKESNQVHCHYYNSDTCPGSSGSPVFYVCKQENGAHPMWLPAVHSHYSTGMQLNCGYK